MNFLTNSVLNAALQICTGSGATRSAPWFEPYFRRLGDAETF